MISREGVCDRVVELGGAGGTDPTAQAWGSRQMLFGGSEDEQQREVMARPVGCQQ